jgi:hypothetical protein
MSVEEQIYTRILSAGTLGVKKTDLRKEFAGVEIDSVIENLVNVGSVFIEKRGVAYTCWHKDHYLQNLLNTDPKFRLTIDAIRSLQISFNKTSDSLLKFADTLANDNLEYKQTGKTVEGNTLEPPANDQTSMQLEEFEHLFDIAVTNNSDSIGWVELAKIRQQICKDHLITNEYFYSLVEEVINSYCDKYELSSGGSEGVTMRGLLHGLVRCI